MEVVGQIWKFLDDRISRGESPISLYGSRRCSKSWTTCQFLLNKAYNYGDKILFATMTENQGDQGVYDDCKNIITTNPAWAPYFTITSSPRRITCRFARDGRVGTCVYRSFKDADTAKGAACDYVYINEANKFSKKQYYAITANARKGVILDYNPEEEQFWADEIVKDENRLHCIWQWNKRHLTPTQIKWFEDLLANASKPDATSADVAFYKRYYLGEYAGIDGDVFTRSNIQRIKTIPGGLRDYFIFCDPSALRGADYFAMVLGATDGEKVYIVKANSVNQGSEAEMASIIKEWCTDYDVEYAYIETNGLQGLQFFDFCVNSGLPVRGWTSRGNKFNRIVGLYQAITTKMIFSENQDVEDYLGQVYEFGEKCEHDDNVDAIASLWMVYKAHRLV